MVTNSFEKADQIVNLVRDFDLLTRDYKIMLVTFYVLAALYFIIMIWTFINMKLYLWDQKRYKTFSVLIFYILALVIEVSRMIMYVNVIIIISAEKFRGHWSNVYFYDSFYVIAMFTKIILGFF